MVGHRGFAQELKINADIRSVMRMQERSHQHQLQCRNQGIRVHHRMVDYAHRSTTDNADAGVR